MKKNDSLWKAILEDVFDDFLLFFYSQSSEIFDLGTGFSFLDKELQEIFPKPEKSAHPRYVDKPACT